MNVGLECGNVAALLTGNLMTHKKELKRLLQKLSLVRGNFTLSSGKVSDYYLDCKLTTMNPEGAVLTGYTILELLDENEIEADAIGGPEIGAVPIVSAVAAVSFFRAEREKQGRPLPAFLVRKQPKGHGRKKQIEGIAPESIRRVVIVDEVCTGGDSIGIALHAVEDLKLDVVAVITLVDREEGGGEKLKEKYGNRYLPIFTAAELRRDEAESGTPSSRAEELLRTK